MSYQILNWLTSGQNSAAVQAIAAAIITVGLLWFTWKAARRHAEAAENTANMAIKQLFQSIASCDNNSQPLLELTLADPSPLPQYQTEDTRGTGIIKNIGLGPAHDIEAFYTTDPARKGIEFNVNFLGIGCTEKFTFNLFGASHCGLTFRYKSGHNSEYQTIIAHGAAYPKQLHQLLNRPYEKLVDEHFQP
jgi:hypothetical protein